MEDEALKKYRVCSEARRFNAFLIKCVLIGFSTNYHVTADRFIIFVQLITRVLLPKCKLRWPGKKLDFEGRSKFCCHFQDEIESVPTSGPPCFLLGMRSCVPISTQVGTRRCTCQDIQAHVWLAVSCFKWKVMAGNAKVWEKRIFKFGCTLLLAECLQTRQSISEPPCSFSVRR